MQWIYVILAKLRFCCFVELFSDVPVVPGWRRKLREKRKMRNKYKFKWGILLTPY